MEIDKLDFGTMKIGVLFRALFFAVNITFIGYYQSPELSVRSIIFTLLRGIIFLIPAFILLPALIGSPGLWLAIPAAELLTLITILLTLPQHK